MFHALVPRAVLSAVGQAADTTRGPTMLRAGDDTAVSITLLRLIEHSGHGLTR